MLEFDSVNHIYKYNNKAVPSVTQLIPKGDWMNYVSKSDMEKAQIEGTANHAKVENYIKKGINPDSYLLTFSEFLNEHQYLYTNIGALVETEKKMYSNYGFAGTPDLIFENAIVDLKRTIGNKKHHSLQLAGYAVLAKEGGYGDIKKWYIIEIKNGKYRLVNVYNPQAISIFLSLVKKYKIDRSFNNYIKTV
jgi:CRISPR/Cas system-associated exonuclease Cas4 (RecB family)